MPSLITIKKVAQLAGVSTATVSRVINNSGYVNGKTRDTVESIMREYHYVPLDSAVNLSKQESSTIGIVIPEIDNVFYSEILHGISEVADENGLSPIIFDTQNNAEKEARALRLISRQRVRGLLLAPAVDYAKTSLGKELKDILTDLQIPVVIVDREADGISWDSVFYQNYESSFAVAEALYHAGGRRMAVITGDLKLKIGRDRLNGFAAGLKLTGLKLRKDDIYEGNFLEPMAYELSRKMLMKRSLPDAVYTCNNRTSLGFLKAAGELGIQVGKDIGLMGNDSLRILDELGIPFSCAYRDTAEMGRIALRLLLKRIDHPDDPREIYRMPFSIALRGSEKKLS